ncbi:hypothetical protein BDQ12DRAFT_689373 [Crucibulum laeve]|uniref:Uncharacterized protein n=1 Tax=Crucibulum laeve TaxID=68775 RepID=A0A5C3LPD6_9AGAR|nr:hypothetical protein BDQ12DRAFT_689373 [Crucibulum laeve]
MDFDTSMEDEYDILGLDSQSSQADQVIWHSTQTTHTYLDTLIKDSVVPIRRSPRLSNHPPTYSESSFASPSVSTKLSKIASSSSSSSMSSTSKLSSRSKPRSKPTSRARLRRSEPPPAAADLSFHILSSIPFVSAQINAGLDQAKNKKQRGMSVGVQDHPRTALGVMQTTSVFPPTRVNGKGKGKERDIGNISAHRSLSNLTLKSHFLRRSNSHLSTTDEEGATDNDVMDGGMDVDKSFNAMEVDQPSSSKTTRRMSMPPPPAPVQLDLSRQQLQRNLSHPSPFSCMDNNRVLECTQPVYQPPPPPPPESIPAPRTPPRQKSPSLKPASRTSIPVDTPYFPSMSQHSSRPPPLGMRRTHTFPSSTPSTSTSNTRLPTRQRGFKPPLMTQVEKQRKEAKRLKEIQQALQSDGGDGAKVTEESTVAVKMEKVKEEPGYPKDAPLPSGSPPSLRREQSTRTSEAGASGNGSNIPGGHWSTNRGSITRSGYRRCSSNTTYTSIPSTHPPSGSQSSGTSHDHHSIVTTSISNTSTSASHYQPQDKSVSRPNGHGMSEPQATLDADQDQNRQVQELLVPNDGDPDSSFGEVDFNFDEDLFQQVVSKYD